MRVAGCSGVDGSDGFVELAARLQAVAFPARLSLLRLLRTPKALSEIRLHPVRRDGGLDPDRYVARQTVERHLKTLTDLGFVVAEDGLAGRLYRASPEMLFLLREDLHRVSALFAGGMPVGGETLVMGDVDAAPPKGPHLVLVKGAYEGKRFPLQDAKEWLLGRDAQAHVNLEYDPYISKRHAAVVRRRGRFYVRNEGRNGTMVDWQALGPDEEVPLKPGAVIGIGRSMMTFHGG